MGNIISIREFISEMYPDAETIPQELLESCEVLFEATKREVQLKVYFQQAFDALRKKKWTVDKIDKEIKKIEKCNNAIEAARKGGKNEAEVLKSSVWWKDQLKYFYYGAALGIIGGSVIAGIGMAIGAALNSAITGGGIVAGAIAGSFSNKHNVVYDPDTKEYTYYAALYKENENAIKWLKEERERILNGTAKKKKLDNIITGKQETANIFCAIELI